MLSKWMKSWVLAEIHPNLNFRKLFYHEDISLWWLNDYPLVTSYDYRFRKIFFLILSLERIIDKEKPDEIIILNKTRDYQNEILELFCQAKSIKTTFIRHYRHSRSFRDRIIALIKPVYSILMIYETMARAIFTKLLNFFHYTVRKKGNLSILLLTFINSFKSRYDHARKKLVFTEFIMSSVMTYLARQHDLMVLLGVSPFSFLKMFKELLIRPSNCFYLDGHVNLTTCRKILQASQIFKERWKILEKNDNFIRIFSFKGVSLWPLYKEHVSRIFHFGILRTIKMFEAARNMLVRKNPDVLLFASENTVVGKILCYHAKKLNKPVIGIQHGEITVNDYDYFHPLKEEHAFLPTYMFTMGNHFKELLITQARFPESNVITTGLPRFDLIWAQKKFFNSREFRSQLGIKPEEKVLVFTTQNKFFNEMKKDILMILKALKDVPTVRLIIKTHPHESTERYENFLAMNGISNVPVLRNVNLYELYDASDFVITRTSTTATEAILMDKNLILIRKLEGHFDYEVQNQYLPYSVASVVANSDDLALSLKKILSDPEYVQEMKKNRNNFIKDHCFSFDGMSTKRIVQQIEKIARDV
ncbi:MAG: UDP-N-acetylglucosamine 2-epimerase [Deltaproteobacteria bacterium]|nr:UDP-N-acetylglucosamine 2-epimerase [Deltaproteobacteria bacterium]